MHERTAIPHAMLDGAETEPLGAMDRIEIHELIARIYLCEDTRDHAALRAIYTDDLVQLHPYGDTRGAEAAIALNGRNPGGFDGIRHHAFDVVTRRVGPDEAEAASYIAGVKAFEPGGGEDPNLPRVVSHALVRDRWRKVDGRWRLYRRVFDQMATSPAMVPDAAERERWARERP